MFAITQSEYYLTLLKYIALTAAGTTAAVLALGLIYLVVFYSHYFR